MLKMYLTMLPVILAGIFNMIFVKTNFYKDHNYPIDCFKNFKDGKRIFGDNKTYIGFFSMIIFSTLFQCAFGYIYHNFDISVDTYLYYDNTFLFNTFIGFLYGFTYMISELPNSFIKRRIGIPPGKTTNKLFFVVDQFDSIVGVMFILYLFSGISISRYLCYVFIGGVTHLMINTVLLKIKIRRNL